MTLDYQEEEDHSDIRPMLRLVTGGKPPTPINWLRSLDIGTCFVTRGKDTKMYNLDEYHVAAHFPKTTVLVHNQNGPTLYLSVDSMRFSDAMELFEILGHTVSNEEEEVNNDQRDIDSGPKRLECSTDAKREHTRFELPKDE